MGSFRTGGARCSHHVQQGERIAEANYPECASDAYSFAQEPTTEFDIDSDDSEVDMGKLKGRRAVSSPSDAA